MYARFGVFVGLLQTKGHIIITGGGVLTLYAVQAPQNDVNLSDVPAGGRAQSHRCVDVHLLPVPVGSLPVDLHTLPLVEGHHQLRNQHI